MGLTSAFISISSSAWTAGDVCLSFVLHAPLRDRFGVKFFAVRSCYILNRMALAQCACRRESVVHRRQQSRPFLEGVTVLEVTNVPVLRFAHLLSPLTLAIMPCATTPCCRRIASVSRNNPRMESASCSSTNVFDRRLSTTEDGSRPKLPPPNNL